MVLALKPRDFHFGVFMETYQSSSSVLFILLGAIMVLAMHAGFAFLEVGTVRKKNQVNALVKILTDFGVSTIAYFFIGYSLAYGINFFSGVDTLMEKKRFRANQVFSFCSLLLRRFPPLFPAVLPSEQSFTPS
jgi:Amt family ammonium transporter